MSRFPTGRAALVVAHPGHELRLHGWLEQAKPRVFVLTDGSGGSGAPRLASTAGLLARVGAKPGSVFGPFTDRALYGAILGTDHGLFTDLVAKLAADFLREGVAVVVGDAAEGYNPVHDACRLLIDAAVAVARVDGGLPVANYAFPLAGRPDATPPGCSPRPIQRRLVTAEFARKRRAADAYPQLRPEIEAAVRASGWDAFRQEAVYPVARDAGAGRAGAPPFYEQYGEQQVRAGRYQHVLRRREHMAPLCRAVWRFVERKGGCPACAC
jgi:hypothetical protein